MRIQSTSFAFTLLVGFLAAVPYSGIDINLPALSATGATLNPSASDVGLTISAPQPGACRSIGLGRLRVGDFSRRCDRCARPFNLRLRPPFFA